MIAIQSLTKQYGSTRVLENAAFTFPNQGLFCIPGPSGCGKTTLLNLLAGFDRDFSGEISVNGTTLSGLSDRELCAYRRDNIGFVFQSYHLLPGYTALQNVLLASEAAGVSPGESRPKAQALLEKLGLAQQAGKKIETLSGGQKQRTAIARALMNDPAILLADEPTGALDRANANQIMELLKALSRDRLVQVITHDQKCAQYADQVLTITDGKLNGGEDAPLSGEPGTLKQKTTPKVSMGKRAIQNVRIRLVRCLAIALVGKALGFDLVLTLWQALGAVGLSCFPILVIGFLASHRLVHTQPADALRK